MQTATPLPPPPPLQTLQAAQPIALFLDFDGTLVELADTPDGITVPPDLVARIEALAATLDGALALVSGRALVDLERHCGPLQVARAGSHGIDRFHADGCALGEAPSKMTREVEERLAEFAADNNLRFEKKPHGGALHTRPNPGAAQQALAFAEQLAGQHGFEVKQGKFVIELVRPGTDKGGAVRAFMQAAPFAQRRPVFVGDDITDEDGIAAANALGGLGILVGDRSDTGARYRLPDPAAVHAWLGL